jgi:hypothetical protein
MAEVIDLTHRKDQEERRLKAAAQGRVQAVAGSLACGFCPRRCAYCGLAIPEPQAAAFKAPYPFCPSCLEEYRAFRRREQGTAGQEAFWHNEQWVLMWQAWLRHMQTVEAFRRTPAFSRLMQEGQD